MLERMVLGHLSVHSGKQNCRYSMHEGRNAYPPRLLNPLHKKRISTSAVQLKVGGTVPNDLAGVSLQGDQLR